MKVNVPAKSTGAKKAAIIATLAVLLTGFLSACGLFTDTTPPGVTAGLHTNDDGSVEVAITANDADSGISSLTVTGERSNGELSTLGSASFEPRDETGVIVPERGITVTISNPREFSVITATARNGTGQEAEQVVLSGGNEPVWPTDLPVSMFTGTVIEGRVQLGAAFDQVRSMHGGIAGEALTMTPYPIERDYGFTWDSTGTKPGVYTLVLTVEFTNGEVFTHRHTISLTEDGA